MTLQPEKIQISETEPNGSSNQPPSLWFSKRLLVTVLMFLCYFNASLIRCNISIAIVDMTSTQEIKIGNWTETKPAEFDWDSITVGFILSVFFYGGLASLGGGYLVTKLGAAVSCSFFMMLCGIIMILHPISLYYNFYLFLICRLLTGTFESFLLISVLQLCSKWIPMNEKSKLMSFVVTGLYLGLAVVHVFCAFLASEWGWQMIFYATGSISLITSLLCYIFLQNQPSEDKWISKKELAYILNETTTEISKQKVKHPYKQILMSAPVWALLGCQFVHMWISTIIVTLAPLYIKDLTKDDTNTVGQISSLTNVVNIFMLPIYGTLLSYVKNCNISTTKIHKTLLGSATFTIGVLFMANAWISDFNVSVISFILIQTVSSMFNLILSILSISIAPNSSGVIAGLVLFVSSLSCILARNVTGFMTMNHSIEEWNNCFTVASIISFLACAIFIFYGSSEAQSWSTQSVADKEQDK